MRFRERTNFLVHRLILAGVSLAAGILALATGCDPRMTSVLRRLEHGKTRPVARQENVTPLRDWALLRMGTFNLGVFGVEKSQQPDTLGRIADIVRQFDIVALQEIRSIDQSVMDKLVREVNALEVPGDPAVAYDYVLGPRLGRTSSKEQYAFIYNTNRISVDTSNVYTLIDEQDLLHREPFVARFISHADDYGPPFTFTLVNIHTDPMKRSARWPCCRKCCRSFKTMEVAKTTLSYWETLISLPNSSEPYHDCRTWPWWLRIPLPTCVQIRHWTISFICKRIRLSSAMAEFSISGSSINWTKRVPCRSLTISRSGQTS